MWSVNIFNVMRISFFVEIYLFIYIDLNSPRSLISWEYVAERNAASAGFPQLSSCVVVPDQ